MRKQMYLLTGCLVLSATVIITACAPNRALEPGAQLEETPEDESGLPGKPVDRTSDPGFRETKVAEAGLRPAKDEEGTPDPSLRATKVAEAGPGPTKDVESAPAEHVPKPTGAVETMVVATPVQVDLSKLTPESPSEVGEPVVAPPPGVPDPSAKMVQLAAQDLAGFLEIDVGEITLRSIEEVQWPDGSLGCAQPDTAYLMAITPGYRIVLQAQGKSYQYHTDTIQTVVLCDPKAFLREGRSGK